MTVEPTVLESTRAAALFDACAYGEGTTSFEVVVPPGGRELGEVEPGDLLVTRALGEGAVARAVVIRGPYDVESSGGRLGSDRVIVRRRDAGSSAQEIDAAHACASGDGPPAGEPDPTGRGPHPLIKRGTARATSRRPSVGFAQQCLNNWMAQHLAGSHACPSAAPATTAYIDQSFAFLRSNGQLPLKVDCFFGVNTDRATRAFQACMGIARDGQIGPITWPLLKQFQPQAVPQIVPPVVPPTRVPPVVVPPVVVPPVVPAVLPPVVPPVLTATSIEIDVDAAFGLYAEWFHPIRGHTDRNLFDPQAREFENEHWASRALRTVDRLRAAGLVQADVGGRLLAPLRGQLVLPRVPPTAGSPFAILMAGNFPAFMPEPQEAPSHQGYLYLQRALASRGIASMSVNVSVVNAFMQNDNADHQRRAQLLALHIALMAALVTGSPSLPTPLRLRTASGAMLDLAVALALQLPADRRDPIVRLDELTTAVRTARVDVDRVGLFGHSRGGTAVAELAQLVGTAVNPTPPDPLAPDPMDDAVARAVVALVRTTSRPRPVHLKAAIAFEPNAEQGPSLSPALLPELYLLAVAGTHDEDTGKHGASFYTDPECAKAMLVIHGATHQRFNTVWRTLKPSRAFTRCPDAAMLDNRAHERVASRLVGDCFEARLFDRPAKLRFFTGEERAPELGVGLTRAWRFPLPISLGSSGVADLDAGVRERVRRRPARGQPPVVELVEPRTARLGSFADDTITRFAQSQDVFIVDRSAQSTNELVISLGNEQDALARRTHVSFRMAKNHNPHSAAARGREPLRNFSLHFEDAAGNRVGRVVAGTAVASPLARAFRTFVVGRDTAPGPCMDFTQLLLQTVEVPIAQFFARVGPTSATLSRITNLVLTMHPARTKSASDRDTFLVIDFALTTRS